ncbi:hypothetical protein KQI76_04155 [Amphibacillus sp. MSJ-3]|uniref:hypothetical protein n=1 Tax=Amphibacillus sp. MSJ-3 TaxID=2841505 RepID=UPI001C0F2314|nr:hypothetical protein [Amphibacillus sp. MSJ-3]MBU5594349.1 hypothetical protein [Amphibacillus sp. MSJ-3]
MSVDRSYLPFKSAREYQDRKMAKWQGFFLSEHTTALNKPEQVIDFSNALSLAEKVLLISQAYSNKFLADITFLENDQTKNIKGFITHLSHEQIGIQAKEKYYFISLEEILMISLAEAIENED